MSSYIKQYLSNLDWTKDTVVKTFEKLNFPIRKGEYFIFVYFSISNEILYIFVQRELYINKNLK